MCHSPPGSSVHRDSPGKNIGVGCHALLQGIFPTQGSKPGLPLCRWILYCLSHQLIAWVQLDLKSVNIQPGVPCWSLQQKPTQFKSTVQKKEKKCGKASHSVCVCVCVCVCMRVCMSACASVLSCVWLFAIPWFVARPAPLLMGFFRQEYWSGLPFSPPGDLPNPGIESLSPALQVHSLQLHHLGRPSGL